MAKLSLENGPYSFNSTTVDRRVPTGVKGVYALGYKKSADSSVMIVLRIGRSDKDLNARLKSYLSDSDYDACTHFFFEVVGTKKQAFDKECILYHDYMPALNVNHPGRPTGTRYCCPVNDEDYCPTCDEV